MILDWSVAARTYPGEIECGDRSAVIEHQNGAIIAVADGLGHGPKAAAAAAAALETLETNAGADIQELVKQCHESIRRTRGAALSVATLDVSHRTLRWCGVGNVDAVLLHAVDGKDRKREAIPLRGGIVGYQLPQLHIASCATAPHDVVIFATDGVYSSFTDGVNIYDPPQVIANTILSKQIRGTDDALVLAVRLVENGH